MESDLLGLGLDPTPQPAQPPAAASTPAATPAAPAQQEQPQEQPQEQQQQQQQQPETPAAAPASDATTTTPAAPAATETSTATPAAANAESTGNATESAPAEPAKWSPVAEDEEPASPELKEIKEKFGGRWSLLRSDPYDEYLKAVGIGFFNRQLASKGTPEQVISVKGEKIFISFHSTFHNQNYTFRLEDSVENLVEKVKQSVFCSYKDGTLTLQMTPVEGNFNKTQEVQRYINENSELVTIYTAGSAVCRRYFVKLPDAPLPLNVVG